MTVDCHQSGLNGVRPLFPGLNRQELLPIGGVTSKAPPQTGRHSQWNVGLTRRRRWGTGAQVQQRSSWLGGRGATSAVRGPGIGCARAPSSRREGCDKSRSENGRHRRCRRRRHRRRAERRRRRRGGETVSGTAKAAGGDPCRGAGGRGGTWRGRGPRGRATRLADGVPPLYPPPPSATGGGFLLHSSPSVASDRPQRDLPGATFE